MTILVAGFLGCAIPAGWGVAGAAREFRVLRDGDTWRLELRLDAKWLPMRSRRDTVRYWRSLTAVGRFCAGVGIKVLTA